MISTEYWMGIAYLTLIAAGSGIVGVTVRQCLLSSWAGPPAHLADLVVGLTSLTVTMEALGSVGMLQAEPLLALILLEALALRLLLRRPGPSPDAPPPAPPTWKWSQMLAGSAALICCLSWAGGVADSLGAGIYRQDSTWYHLSFSAGFFQSGDTWALQFTDPMALAAWFYPQNSELLHSLGMLAFGSDFLSLFLNLSFLGLTLFAAWCTGRPAGAGPEALIAVAIVLGAGVMSAQAGNAPNDVLGLFFLVAALALLLNGREAVRSSARIGSGPGAGVLLIAGLAAGFAAGVKVPLLAPVGVLTLGLPYALDRGTRLRGTLVWTAGLLVGGGYWYLRNTVHSGNPLPWLELGPLSAPDQASLYPRPPHSVADYLGSPNVWWNWFVPGLADAFGPLWPLVLAGALAGLVLALARSGPLRLFALAGLAAAFAYVFIPISASGSPGRPSGFEANLRYLAPALVIGLTLLASELRERHVLGRYLAPTLAAVFAVNVLLAQTWNTDWRLAAVLCLVALLAVVVAVGFGRHPTAGLAAATLVAAAILAAGNLAEDSYLRDRYLLRTAPALDNPGFRGSPQWKRIQAWANGVSDARIAIVGPPAAFGQYTLLGRDLSNRVSYLGDPGPHGSFRPLGDCATFRRALDRYGADFMVVTPAVEYAPSATPQETAWTAGPNAIPVINRAPAAVFRLTGRLDPDRCTSANLPPILRVPGGGVAIPGAAAPTGR